ncbi:MAG: (2Fe-2S)-binding protein [Gemmatimonadota bacterium]
MNATIEILANGKPIQVPPGISVAAALMSAGISDFRTSVLGEPRGPLCGMGICQECRVTINDRLQQRSCLVLVEAGMRIETGEG